MADIKLKDINGTETSYTGISKIEIPKSVGSGNIIFEQKNEIQNTCYVSTPSGVKTEYQFINGDIWSDMVERYPSVFSIYTDSKITYTPYYESPMGYDSYRIQEVYADQPVTSITYLLGPPI